MAHQDCDNCIYELLAEKEEPCNTCVSTGHRMFSKFKPKTYPNHQEDPVNKPSHYMLMEGVEVRDVCEALSTKLFDNTAGPFLPAKPLFISDYVQMMQYLMRFMDKNGKQDLEKARWYLDKLIEAYE